MAFKTLLAINPNKTTNISFSSMSISLYHGERRKLNYRLDKVAFE